MKIYIRVDVNSLNRSAEITLLACSQRWPLLSSPTAQPEGRPALWTRQNLLHELVVGELSSLDNDKPQHSSCLDAELLRFFAKQSLHPLVNPSATKSEHQLIFSQADHALCHPWHGKFLSAGHPIINLLMDYFKETLTLKKLSPRSSSVDGSWD